MKNGRSIEPHPELISRSVTAGELSQFLESSHEDDVLTELLQNELDAGSSRTLVRFEQDQLVVEGNGQAVNEAGWNRLSYVLSNGVDVPSKVAQIGNKNRGLRTCFLLGDEIVVRSDARLTRLFACRPDGKRTFSPVTSKAPKPDPTAPQTGCRIEVPYRTRPLTGGGADLARLDVTDGERVDRIFHRVVEQLPLRFLGVVRPPFRTRWVVVLQHWKQGLWTFTFEALRRARRQPPALFRRRCVTIGPDKTSTTRAAEVWEFGHGRFQTTANLPPFFGGRGRLRCDVSWRVDDRGRPCPEPGHIRYPIAFPTGGSGAMTRCGAYFCAPFVSDTTRHGLASNRERENDDLRQACSTALLDALRSYLLMRHGPSALNLLVAPGVVDSIVLLQLVRKAAEAGALLVERRTSAQRGRNKQTSGLRRRWALSQPGRIIVVAALQLVPWVVPAGAALVLVERRRIGGWRTQAGPASTSGGAPGEPDHRRRSVRCADVDVRLGHAYGHDVGHGIVGQQRSRGEGKRLTVGHPATAGG